jgi:hypothetical protein
MPTPVKPHCPTCSKPKVRNYQLAALAKNAVRQLFEEKLKSPTGFPLCRGCYYVVQAQEAAGYSLAFQLQVLFVCTFYMYGK